MELQLARELMSNKALQEQQIVAAKNVMELISPSNRTRTKPGNDVDTS
ncbi:putative Lipid-A-disaccharide synthase [Corchorus olitorius]|uniref:Lipid-A-disaccharide synthase n=1 Tax=Corchorus olitorius TaxID=93759 RepID=A0A1R3GD95_9ROSI|nr:putative Lipid-A-disaccharide synthase [Corchorus olitorius]